MVVVGDIFVSTWGWEQTNADFFQVVGLTPKGVKVRHIKSKITESSPQSMSGSALPIKNAFDGDVKTKRLRNNYLGETVFDAGESMGTAELWDGNPVGVSWYG
jgi:hypothetical protein